MTAADLAADLPQLVTPIAIKPDRELPAMILGSLLLHALILLPLLLPKETAPPQPQEIPVELVHEQPPAPKPPPPKKDAPKPQPKPPEQKPQEKAKTPEKPKSTEKPKSPEKPKPPEAEKPQKKKADPPKEEKKPDPPKKPDEKKPEEKKPAEKPPESNTERMNKLLGEETPAVDKPIALPGMSIDGTDSVSYHQLVMSKIAKAKREILIAGKPDAVVVVAFTLSETGAVASVSIKSPSGSPDLDKEALSMIDRGEPYPPPPLGAPRDFTFGLKMRSGP